MQTTSYAYRVELEMTYDEAVERVTDALKAEGFGVLTEIDMKEKFSEKLGADFRRYVILGACNPPLAYEALQAELEVGILLPCNVVVYENDGRSVVAAMAPKAAMGVVGENGALSEVAADADRRIRRVIGSLGALIPLGGRNRIR